VELPSGRSAKPPELAKGTGDGLENIEQKKL
jgi:hypothetical protein